MKNVIEFLFGQENEIGNVMLDESEVLVAREMADVRWVAGDQIVDRDDAMTLGEKTIGQMRSQKTGATGDNRDGFLCATGHF